jgi:hypothetical protein
VVYCWCRESPTNEKAPPGVSPPNGADHQSHWRTQMAQPIVAPADRARAAAEYRDIHLAACRYRRQGLVCSTCSDLSERAARAEVATVHAPAETLTISNGIVSWSRAA